MNENVQIVSFSRCTDNIPDWGCQQLVNLNWSVLGRNKGGRENRQSQWNCDKTLNSIPHIFNIAQFLALWISSNQSNLNPIQFNRFYDPWLHTFKSSADLTFHYPGRACIKPATAAHSRLWLPQCNSCETVERSEGDIPLFHSHSAFCQRSLCPTAKTLPHQSAWVTHHLSSSTKYIKYTVSLHSNHPASRALFFIFFFFFYLTCLSFLTTRFYFFFYIFIFQRTKALWIPWTNCLPN